MIETAKYRPLRIVFRIEDGDGQILISERQIQFFAGTNLYDRLARVLLVMAKLIKASLQPSEAIDAEPSRT